MKKEEFILDGYKNFKLKIYVYGNYTKNFKGIVYVAHGKGEHKKYYEDLAKELVYNSYLVVLHDHRGHGEYTDGSREFKLTGESNYFLSMVYDVKIINSFLKNKFPNKKVFMFGHSMGAWILLRYAQIYGEKIEKLILSGIGIKSRFKFNLIVLYLKMSSVFRNPNNENKFFDSMVNKNLNSKFKNLKSKSILTTNEKSLKLYSKDNLRIKTYSLKFNYNLFLEIRNAMKRSSIGKVHKDTKVFIIAGSYDPICFFEEGVVNLNKSFLMENLNSSYRIYKSMRHNLLAEKNSHQVINDILKFLN